MFPIGDSPNPRGIAWVTYALIAINVFVYVMCLPMMSEPADFDDPAALEYLETLQADRDIPPDQIQAAARSLRQYDVFIFENGSRPSNPSLLDMLKSMFLHAGFMHLFGNMLFLWIYGNNVEHRLGRVFYLLAYLATGYAAALGDMLLRPGSGIPAVGASGAISGVLGMYFIWFPHNKVRMLIFFPPLMRMFEIPARWVLGFYIVGQNIVPVVMGGMGGGGGGGVAHGAHIAGFIAGLVLAVGDKVLERVWPARQRKVEESESDLQGAPAPREPALRMRAQGTASAAAHLDRARVLIEDLNQPTAAYQHIYAAQKAGLSPDQEVEAKDLLRRLRMQVRSLPKEAYRWR